MHDPLYHFVTVEDDDVVIYYGADQARVIQTLQEYRSFLKARADAQGVEMKDLTVMASSSMDFPEENTKNADTIALAHLIRRGGGPPRRQRQKKQEVPQ